MAQESEHFNLSVLYNGEKVRLPMRTPLTIDQLRSAFPNVTGLRYMDQGDPYQSVIMVDRDGVLQTPPGGWGKVNREYFAVNHSAQASSRPRPVGGFEAYRQQKEEERRHLSLSTSGRGRSELLHPTTMIRVGIASKDKDGNFSKIKGNNNRCVGGCVLAGPFHKRDATPATILAASIVKFKQDDCRFDDEKGYQLTYGDGREVENLPDESGPFTLEGYKKFKGQPYDRLRLYVCSTDSQDQQSSILSSTLPVVASSNTAVRSQVDSPTLSRVGPPIRRRRVVAAAASVPDSSVRQPPTGRPQSAAASGSSNVNVAMVPKTSVRLPPVQQAMPTWQLTEHHHLRGVPVNDLLLGFGQTVVADPVVSMTLTQLTAEILDNALSVTWGDPVEIKLRLESNPFAAGAMRKAFRGHIVPGHGGAFFEDRVKVVVKEYLDDVAAPWAARYDGDIQLTKSKLLEKEIQAQTLTGVFMCQFRRKVLAKINFGPRPKVVPVFKVQRAGQRVGAIERHIGEQWVKYSTNDGRIIEIGTPAFQTASKKMASFSHFVLDATQGQATVLDLQGVDLTISDPQVITVNQDLFSCGNMGADAIARFQREHRCSMYCRIAGLRDIRDFEMHHASDSSDSGLPSLLGEPAEQLGEPAEQAADQSTVQLQGGLPSVRVDTEARVSQDTTITIESSSPSSSSSSSTSTGGRCTICLVPEQTHALLPCGHSNFCQKCAHKFLLDDSCPVCRNNVVQIVRLYPS